MKLKSSLLAGLASLCMYLPATLPEISKPYLGTYTCKYAALGSKDMLDEYDDLKLELVDEENFRLLYQDKTGARKSYKGKYAYDEARGVLTLKEEKSRIKREFPFADGQLTVSFPVGGKTCVLRFERE